MGLVFKAIDQFKGDIVHIVVYSMVFRNELRCGDCEDVDMFDSERCFICHGLNKDDIEKFISKNPEFVAQMLASYENKKDPFNNLTKYDFLDYEVGGQSTRTPKRIAECMNLLSKMEDELTDAWELIVEIPIHQYNPNYIKTNLESIALTGRCEYITESQWTRANAWRTRELCYKWYILNTWLNTGRIPDSMLGKTKITRAPYIYGAVFGDSARGDRVMAEYSTDDYNQMLGLEFEDWNTDDTSSKLKDIMRIR